MLASHRVIRGNLCLQQQLVGVKERFLMNSPPRTLSYPRNTLIHPLLSNRITIKTATIYYSISKIIVPPTMGLFLELNELTL